MVKKSIKIVLLASAFATVTVMSSIEKEAQRMQQSFNAASAEYEKVLKNAVNVVKDVIKKSEKAEKKLKRAPYKRPLIPELVAMTTVPLPLATRAYRSIKSFFRIKDNLIDLNVPCTRDFPRLNNLVFSPKTMTEIQALKKSLKTKKGSLKNPLITGKPGTGKTVLAESLANDLDMYYAVFPASFLLKYELPDALDRIDHLFDWLNNQSKPVMLIIEEADMIFAQRSSGMSEEKCAVLAQMMSHMGTESKKYSVVALTDYPQEFDQAMTARFNLQIALELPGVEERCALIEGYIKTSFRKSSIDTTFFTQERIRNLAERTEGMSGRHINYLISMIYDAAFNAGALKKPSVELVDNVLNKYLAESRD